MPTVKSVDDLKKNQGTGHAEARHQNGQRASQVTWRWARAALLPGARNHGRPWLETIETGGLQGIVVTQDRLHRPVRVGRSCR